jgi:uncharacterized protein YciI
MKPILKNVKFSQLILLILLILHGLVSVAQIKNPVYDSLQAKKLGADDLGMKYYSLVILKTGPANISHGPHLDSLFQGHFANMKKLSEQHVLVLAGPIEKNEKGYRGIFVLTVTDPIEVRKLCENDPSVKAGVFELEIYKWYSTAALDEINAIHKTISKRSPGE